MFVRMRVRVSGGIRGSLDVGGTTVGWPMGHMYELPTRDDATRSNAKEWLYIHRLQGAVQCTRKRALWCNIPENRSRMFFLSGSDIALRKASTHTIGFKKHNTQVLQES